MKTTLTHQQFHPLRHYSELLSLFIKSPVNDNLIDIDEAHGSGTIKVIHLEEGFYLASYNFSLNTDFVFKWFQETAGDEQFYKLVFNIGSGCTLNKQYVNMESGLAENATIFYSTDFSKDTFIPKGYAVNRIGILFTKTWLENNFSEASDKLFELANILVTKNKPTYLSEEMLPKHYQIVKELSKEMTKENVPLLHNKLKSILLLNDFLTKIVDRDNADIKANQSAYFAQIVKVESRMRDYFDKQMPNISVLAKEFHISPATLKRHFKIVYGKSIYNYYLEKKLALGKYMINAQTKSVSEIAYALGYNKINSFSKAFRKQYGILPKDMNALYAGISI